MKQNFMQKLFLAVIIFTSIAMASCSEDKDVPIHLIDHDNNDRWDAESGLRFNPFGNGKSFTIYGGDGNYKVHAEQKDVVEVTFADDKIKIKPRSVGDATVTITDNANHIYTLRISVNYRSSNYQLNQVVRTVTGEDLTLKQIDEIKQKATPAYPVHPGGIYRFTYKNAASTEGDVFIDCGGKDKTQYSGTFRILEGELNDAPIRIYVLNIKGKETKLYMTFVQAVPGIRLNMPPPAPVFAFSEDVTEKYKAEYPAVGSVYVHQLVTGN